MYLSSATAYTTTMQDQICLASCRRHSSSVTWLAYVTGSSSCLELLVSGPHYCLCATFTVLSSVSSVQISVLHSAVICTF